MTESKKESPQKESSENGTRDGKWKGTFGANIHSGTVILYGGKRVTVENCRRILQYTPAEILLEQGKKVVFIRGKNLTCTSFSGHHTTVEGQVESVGFLHEGVTV